MRLAVLGGAGLTGQCIVRILSASRDVEEVVVCDISREKLEKLSEQLDSGKIETFQVDVRDVEKTAKAVAGVDVVVNAVQYYFNLEVMKAALKAGAHYLDLGGLYHMTLRQLEFSQQFRDAGLAAIIGLGAQPGISNIMARLACENLDKVTSITIRDGYRDLSASSGFRVTWSLQTLMDEMVMDAIIYEDGELRAVPALSRWEEVSFPEPVGPMRTYVTIHSEVATLPTSFRDKGLRRCDWMEGGEDLLKLKFLADLGFGLTEIEAAGSKLRPRAFLADLLESRGLVGYSSGETPNDWEVTRVVVEGERLGARSVWVLDAVIPPKPEWGMSCSQYGVGVPAALGALMLAGGEIEGSGVLPPERCVDPQKFIERLGKYGVKVRLNRSEDLN
ncbi:Lysine 6-dehydrogenase [archaeon HR01]|nr:Lysine 6-dehydrogenase [archaeon HR01]